jgi:hypothetical protein
MVIIETLAVKLHVLISQKDLDVIFELYSPKNIEKNTSIVQNTMVGWLLRNGILSQVACQWQKQAKGDLTELNDCRSGFSHTTEHSAILQALKTVL